MITLEATRLHWINDDGTDDARDLCSHSPVRFVIDGNALLSPMDGDFTVSAASLFLLRTLSGDHTVDTPIAEHLFPCCGNLLYDDGGDEIAIVGCPNGANFWIRHKSDSSVEIIDDIGHSLLVSSDEWSTAVKGFSAYVLQFHEVSSKKIFLDKLEATAYAKLLREWKLRILG